MFILYVLRVLIFNFFLFFFNVCFGHFRPRYIHCDCLQIMSWLCEYIETHTVFSFNYNIFQAVFFFLQVNMYAFLSQNPQTSNEGFIKKTKTKRTKLLRISYHSFVNLLRMCEYDSPLMQNIIGKTNLSHRIIVCFKHFWMKYHLYKRETRHSWL